MASRQLTDFQILTRTIFGCLRTHFHQQAIRRTIQGSVNSIPYIIRMKNQAAKAFNPCIPTIDTSHLLQGNANNWLQTGLQISDEHHTKAIASLLFKVNKMTKEEEQRAWDVACNWARSKYPRIQDWIFIQVAEDLNLMGINISLHGPVLLSTTAPAPCPESITTQVLNNEQTYCGDVRTSPKPNTPHTTNLSPPTKSRDPPSTIMEATSQSLGLSPVIPQTITSQHRRTGVPRILLPAITTHSQSEPSHSRPFTTKDFHRSSSPPKDLAIRHEHRGNKKENWSLTPDREILIIGDSNISRLPPISNTKVQVDSYPGANLIQAIHLIKYKTPTTVETKKVLLCFGLNDRNKNNTAILNNNLNRLLSSARDTFPNAIIYIPSINFSTRLPHTLAQNITNLNKIIEQFPTHIAKLNREDFTTGSDRIHWTPNTAKKMWDHWRRSLGLRGLRHDYM